MRGRKIAGPHHQRPSRDVIPLAYGLRMRNAAEQRKVWAAYVIAVRQATGLSRAQFAGRLRTDPTTVWRWETARQKPESLDVVEKIASTFAVDLDQALAAASLRPTAQPTAEPEIKEDPEILAIMKSSLPPAKKRQLIAHVRQRQEQDAQQRQAEVEHLIRIVGRGA